MHILSPPSPTMDFSLKAIAAYVAISITTLIVGQLIMGFFGSNKFPVEGKVSFSLTPHETSHDHNNIANNASRQSSSPALPRAWVSAQLPSSQPRAQTSSSSLVALPNSRPLLAPSRSVVFNHIFHKTAC